jgi:hypothetical protein
MCLQVLAEIFGNAVGIFLLAFFGFIILFYGAGLLISIFIGLVVWFALLLMNPMLYVFIIALVVGGFLLLTK